MGGPSPGGQNHAAAHSYMRQHLIVLLARLGRVDEARRQPRSQLFLVFTDGTYYEFFSPEGDLEGASAIDQGGLAEVRRYQGAEGIVLQASAPVTPGGGRPSRRDIAQRG